MRNKKYTKRIELCLGPRMLSQLKLLAKQKEITVNELIRYILTSWGV